MRKLSMRWQSVPGDFDAQACYAINANTLNIAPAISALAVSPWQLGWQKGRACNECCHTANSFGLGSHPAWIAGSQLSRIKLAAVLRVFNKQVAQSCLYLHAALSRPSGELAGPSLRNRLFLRQKNPPVACIHFINILSVYLSIYD